MIKLVEEKGASLIRDPGGSLVVADVMLYGDGGMSPCPPPLAPNNNLDKL